MTLSGVLKDILLVCASLLIFRDPVSGLQVFGYSIALCGLVYYRLGADKLKDYMGQGQRAWADYGVRHPALRRLLVLGLVIMTFVVLMAGVSIFGAIPPDYDAVKLAHGKFKEAMGGTGA